jgi:hypothetical protein
MPSIIQIVNQLNEPVQKPFHAVLMFFWSQGELELKNSYFSEVQTYCIQFLIMVL